MPVRYHSLNHQAIPGLSDHHHALIDWQDSINQSIQNQVFSVVAIVDRVKPVALNR